MSRVMLIVFALFIISIPQAQAGDIAGSSDHPVVGRFSGSSIIGYDVKSYNEYVLPEGGVLQYNKDGWTKYKLSKSTVLEGKVTRIHYLSPKGPSTLEVYKNYERALKKSGFEEVFSCKYADGNCGYNLTMLPTFQPDLVPYAYKGSDHRYITMKKIAPEGDIYVSIMVFQYDFDYYTSRLGHAMVQLDVIEVEPLDDTQIEVVTADDISKEIGEQGRIALYGIYFDTNKSNIKPESDAELAEIVKALANDTNLKLHVVGHTDNTGSFSHNMNLSKMRANSVVNALVSKGVDASRLTPNGVSSLAPVASNASDAGRAKNRRVELVAQ